MLLPPRIPASRLAPLALALICLSCLSAHAQTVREAPRARTASDDCSPEHRDDCPPGNSTATAQIATDAPLPSSIGLRSGSPPAESFDRGPLKVRNYGLSLALDHPLSSHWVLGGLVNVAKGRIERSQTETVAASGSPTQVVHSDTTVNTRSTSVAGTLSYLTRDAIAIEGALSYMRTQLDTRLADDSSGTPGEFTGQNVAHGLGLWLSASRAWRFGSRALVPQLGLEYVDSHINALQLVPVDPASPTADFNAGEQRRRTLAVLLGIQLQQPVSTHLGTLTPYVRATARERIWEKASTAASRSGHLSSRDLDPDAAESRSSLALALGAIAQFTHGISSFIDVSYRTGSNQLRETRLSLGLKFEP